MSNEESVKFEIVKSNVEMTLAEEAECVWGQNGKKYDYEEKGTSANSAKTKVQRSADCEETSAK